MSEDSAKTVCSFKKGSNRGNIRKRKQEDFAVEDTSATTVVAAKKDNKGIIQSTKEMKKQSTEELTYASNKSAIPANQGQLATAHIETETERDKDATAIRRRAKEMHDETIYTGEEAERVYKGLANYTEWVDKREQSGLAKGSGIRAGPVRTTVYARAITRYDYQPDVCKDYKETGYCGYGDSCKFMHDRGDYKNSIELEKEWESEQLAKKAAAAAAEANGEPAEATGLEGVPFACPICRKPFTDPVKTKCGHYYCELCALNNIGRKGQKCLICDESTGGTFSSASADMRKKLQRAAELYYRPEEDDEQTNDHQVEEQ